MNFYYDPEAGLEISMYEMTPEEMQGAVFYDLWRALNQVKKEYAKELGYQEADAINTLLEFLNKK